MGFCFNLSLVPIGNSYWVTATKIGSNYIKTFANPNERFLRLTISNVFEEHEIDLESLYIRLPNGLKFKCKIFDSDNVDYTKDYTQEQLINIFNKVSVVLIRNPLMRFHSGLVQKVSELYININSAINTNTLNNVLFHENVYFDLTQYDVDYSLLISGFGTTPNKRHPRWETEWNHFCNQFLIDLFKYPYIDRILLEDLHTQPVYHLFYTILNGLPNWNKIQTLDINELDSCSQLIINEIGNVEYDKRYESLHNREEWNDVVEGLEYVNILKRVSNKRLYFESHIINEYYQTAPFYILDRMYYDILTTKRYKKLL